jgi:hypothetical protein
MESSWRLMTGIDWWGGLWLADQELTKLSEEFKQSLMATAGLEAGAVTVGALAATHFLDITGESGGGGEKGDEEAPEYESDADDDGDDVEDDNED